MQEQNNSVNNLAHTKWSCKYHIVFAPKYRRKESRDKGNHKDVMYVERSRDNRRALDAGSCTPVVEHTTQDVGSIIHGVFKREEFADDL